MAAMFVKGVGAEQRAVPKAVQLIDHALCVLSQAIAQHADTLEPEPDSLPRGHKLHDFGERPLKSHEPFDRLLCAADGNVCSGCRARPCAFSAALRSRSAAARRTSRLVISDPPVANLATSWKILRCSLMAVLPVGRVMSPTAPARQT